MALSLTRRELQVLMLAAGLKQADIGRVGWMTRNGADDA